MKLLKSFFDSLLRKYQKDLEESMKLSELIFDRVDLLDYKFLKISLNRGGSHAGFSNWLKNKKATINPKNNDDKCFKYAITVVLKHKNILKDQQRISKIKTFIN